MRRMLFSLWPHSEEETELSNIRQRSMKAVRGHPPRTLLRLSINDIDHGEEKNVFSVSWLPEVKSEGAAETRVNLGWQSPWSSSPDQRKSPGLLTFLLTPSVHTMWFMKGSTLKSPLYISVLEVGGGGSDAVLQFLQSYVLDKVMQSCRHLVSKAGHLFPKDWLFHGITKLDVNQIIRLWGCCSSVFWKPAVFFSHSDHWWGFYKQIRHWGLSCC